MHTHTHRHTLCLTNCALQRVYIALCEGFKQTCSLAQQRAIRLLRYSFCKWAKPIFCLEVKVEKVGRKKNLRSNWQEDLLGCWWYESSWWRESVLSAKMWGLTHLCGPHACRVKAALSKISTPFNNTWQWSWWLSGPNCCHGKEFTGLLEKWEGLLCSGLGM